MVELFEQSTQFRFWRFSRQQLAQIRQETNMRAIERVRQAIANEQKETAADESVTKPANPVEEKALSVEDQMDLCGFYERKIVDYCQFFAFPIRVQATAIVFFKRFYLHQSCMDYSPKDTMLTCLFLATKTENHYTSIEKYAGQLPKVDAQMILDMEFVVADALRFHFAVYHPYIALHGIFLDAQRVVKDLARLQAAYEKAIEKTHVVMWTDLPLIYMPSQLAVSVFHLAAQDLQLDLMSSYLRPLVEEQGGDMEKLQVIVDNVAASIKEYKQPSQARVKEIDRRLHYWRNPELDPNSHLYIHHVIDHVCRYKKKKELEENEQEEKRVKRLEEQQAADQQVQDALFATTES